MFNGQILINWPGKAERRRAGSKEAMKSILGRKRRGAFRVVLKGDRLVPPTLSRLLFN